MHDAAAPRAINRAIPPRHISGPHLPLRASGALYPLLPAPLASYQSDPRENRGLGAALETVQQGPFGSYMLGAIAVGLLIYGAFMFAVAFYRRIEAG